MATSSDLFCGVCNAQQINQYAEHWCPECGEGLCSECQVHHSFSKATKTHEIISIDQNKTLQSSISEIVHHCEDHGHNYTNYCPRHDQMCCQSCISTTHRGCNGFLSLSEIVRTAKTSTLLDSMEQSLNDIENNIEKVIKNRENNLSKITQQRQTFCDELKKRRDKINARLDKMEQILFTEVNTAETKLRSKLEKLINRLSKERNSVQALKIKLKNLKDHASDLQTFFGSRTYQPEVEKAEIYMKSLSEDGSLNELNLKYNTDVKLLEIIETSTLGSVSIETCPPSLILKTTKDKQAQVMAVIPQPSQKSINDTKLSLVHTYHLPELNWISVGYRGCIIHSSGKLIFTDCTRRKLTVLNNDGSFHMRIPCSSWVNDVTAIDAKSVAASTDNGIDIISIASKEREKCIKARHRCYGIEHNNGTLLWCEEKKGIQRMDLSNGSINTLVKTDHMPEWSYITTHGNKIYQTNHKTKKVTCYAINGEILWDYKNESVLKDPLAITVDSNGNIYVTSYSSHDVVVISADGKDGRKVLREINGLKNPWGIYYDKTKDNIMIVNWGGRAFLYHVV